MPCDQRAAPYDQHCVGVDLEFTQDLADAPFTG
jgi:hypothetical protein